MEVPDILNFKIIVLGHQGTPPIIRRGKVFTRSTIRQGRIPRYLPRHSRRRIRHQSSLSRTRPPDPATNLGYSKNEGMQAGQELFRSLVKSFYKGISAVFFVYSMDSLESFQQLQSWSAEVKEYAHEEVVMFLVAAKGDIDK
jgi:hypothetical protein